MTIPSCPITLRLEGARARRGVALSDFETFIYSFIAALRDFDRDRRGAPTRKSGHPEARARAVTAFRLVAFREGSGIATIEPDQAETTFEAEPMVETEPISLANLRALLESVEQEEPLPDSVTEALEKALRSVGDDGSLAIEISGQPAEIDVRPVTIDLGRLQRIRAAEQTPAPRKVSSISGRLHQVDFEPDRLAVRASDGVDWVCSFPEALENQVATLVNRVVWARGTGVQQSPRRGTMALTAIEAIDDGIQTSLFTAEPIPLAHLETSQGITRPQGFGVLVATDWTDEDDAYLAALAED